MPIAIEVGFDLDMTLPEPADESTDTEEIDAEKIAEEEELARLEREETITQSETIDLKLARRFSPLSDLDH